VDSSVLAALAHRALGDKAIAVTADSQTLSPGELECAKAVAKEIGIKHKIISYDELDEPGLLIILLIGVIIVKKDLSGS